MLAAVGLLRSKIFQQKMKINLDKFDYLNL